MNEANYASSTAPEQPVADIGREEPIAVSEGPQKCLQAECTKIVPGRGWCSLRHRDMWRSANGMTFNRNLPENIKVEIGKRGSKWNIAWNQALLEAKEIRRKQEAERTAASNTAPPATTPMDG